MDEELLATIADTLEKMQESVRVKYADTSNSDPLIKVIVKSLEKYYGKEAKGTLEEIKNSSDKQTSEVKESVGSVADVIKNMQDDTKKSLLDNTDEIVRGHHLSEVRVARIINAINKIAISLGKEIFNNTKLKMGWVSQLENAGIHLANGFDNSWHQLSNVSRMTGEEWTQMLVKNSVTLNRMNSLGFNHMYKLMKASGDVVGKYGYNAEKASAVMVHYAETVGRVSSAEQLRNRNMNSEVDYLAQHFRRLSVATGKSVELLIQEQKLKEQSLWKARIAGDVRKSEIYSSAQQLGMSDNVIQAAMTGVMNDEASQFLITPAGREMFRAVQQLSRNPSLAVLPTLKSAGVRSKGMASRGLSSMSDATAAALSTTDVGKAMMTGFDVATTASLLNITKTSGSVDEKAVNAMAEREAQKAEVRNNLTDAFSTSIKNATTALETFNSAFEVYKDFTGTSFGSYAIGIAKAIIPVAGQLFAMSMMMKFVTSSMMGGVGKINLMFSSMSKLATAGMTLAKGLGAFSAIIGGITLFASTNNAFLASLGGLLAGVGVGMFFGPTGMIVGGLLGALLAGGFQIGSNIYHDRDWLTGKGPASNVKSSANIDSDTMISNDVGVMQTSESTNRYLVQIAYNTSATATNTANMLGIQDKEYTDKRLSFNSELQEAY